MQYILIFENSFKTVISHEFTKKYPKENSYLEIQNYDDSNPKKTLQQISILIQTIRDKVDQPGAIKHYIEEHGAVPLWVLVNFLTIGNLSHLYGILKISERNAISKYYSQKYNSQYSSCLPIRINDMDITSALKVFNLVRNICAHDERLYNSNFKNIKSISIAEFYGITNYDNSKLIVAILYLKIVLNKKYFKSFYSNLLDIFERYQSSFYTVSFKDILQIMGIDLTELNKLK